MDAKLIWVEPAWGAKHHLHHTDWRDSCRYKWSICGHAITDTKHLFEAVMREKRGDEIPQEEKCKLCQRNQKTHSTTSSTSKTT